MADSITYMPSSSPLYASAEMPLVVTVPTMLLVDISSLIIHAAVVPFLVTITFDDTIMHSVSDISNDVDFRVQGTKKRKWTYTEWMTEDPICVLTDSNGGQHPPCKFPVKIGKSNKKYRKNRTCLSPTCKKLSTFFCAECGTFCHSNDPAKARDKCFRRHVQDHKRTSSRLVSR